MTLRRFFHFTVIFLFVCVGVPVDAGVIYFLIIDLFCYFGFVLLTNLSYGFTFVVCKFLHFVPLLMYRPLLLRGLQYVN